MPCEHVKEALIETLCYDSPLQTPVFCAAGRRSLSPPAARAGEQAVDYPGRAIAMEDKLLPDEPSPWYFPVRQSLGAVLLDLGGSKKRKLFLGKIC